MSASRARKSSRSAGPYSNCVLNVGVLDDRVWHTNGQYVFDQDAVGQDLSDVSVAGTRQRATRRFQLNRNDTMTVLTK